MTTSSQLSIRFWGVRGSLPSPGPATQRIGGNTACVEVMTGDSRLILDAGSGLRALGDHLLRTGASLRIPILLSHVHWDHVMGLPFFAPLYLRGADLDLACGPMAASLPEILRRQMSAPSFPVELDGVSAHLDYRTLQPGQRFALGQATIEVGRTNHPGGAFAFRIESAGRAMVYATDHEHGTELDAALTRLCHGADLLIYDAQYRPEEYDGRRGWGHSTWAEGCRIAEAAGVGRLALFHHDPRRCDDDVEEMAAGARDRHPGAFAATEGLLVDLDAKPGVERAVAA